MLLSKDESQKKNMSHFKRLSLKTKMFGKHYTFTNTLVTYSSAKPGFESTRMNILVWFHCTSRTLSRQRDRECG